MLSVFVIYSEGFQLFVYSNSKKVTLLHFGTLYSAPPKRQGECLLCRLPSDSFLQRRAACHLAESGKSTMDEEYDAIVLGTGLKECIISGLLSSVEHLKVSKAQLSMR